LHLRAYDPRARAVRGIDVERGFRDDRHCDDLGARLSASACRTIALRAGVVVRASTSPSTPTIRSHAARPPATYPVIATRAHPRNDATSWTPAFSHSRARATSNRISILSGGGAVAVASVASPTPNARRSLAGR